MHRFSYRALPLLLSLHLLAFMGVVRTDNADAPTEVGTSSGETSESALRISERFSFGDMELRILSDCSEGLCAPNHSIAWGNGETLNLSPDWIVDPIESVTVCDLDCDGDPELAITTACCGSGRYSELLLLEWAMGQWTPHRLCELPDYATRGRMGHERITIWEDRVEVEFPLYNEEDPNCCPTAGRRSISYIFADDAFRFDRSVDGPASEEMSWQG